MSAGRTAPMIVYDREGELALRKKGWLGRTSWKKYYAVLCRLRRCLYLFDGYWLYERHLLELNGYDNEYRSWSECISLQSAGVYVTTTYFKRQHTFELYTPTGIYYLSSDSESALRGWLFSFDIAGVTLKSDEKPLLLWRSVDEDGRPADSFNYSRALSAMPAHERPKTRGWDSGYGIAKLVSKLSSKAKGGPVIPRGPAPTPIASPTTTSNIKSITSGLGIGELATEPTPDPSFGKHGMLAQLGQSIFACFRGDSLASTDPSSPFFDAAAAERGSTSSTSDRTSRWLSRFFRTVENAAGQPVLLRYRSRDTTTHVQKASHTIILVKARVFDLAEMHARSVAYIQNQLDKEELERWKAMRETHVSKNSEEDDDSLGPPPLDSKQRKARKAELRARLSSAYRTNPIFPVPLPAFAPSGPCDFGLCLRPEPGVPSHAGCWTFFRAPTPREKKKWVNVLRNLTGERTKDRSTVESSEEAKKKAAAAAAAQSQDTNAGRKQLKILKPRDSMTAAPAAVATPVAEAMGALLADAQKPANKSSTSKKKKKKKDKAQGPSPSSSPTASRSPSPSPSPSSSGGPASSATKSSPAFVAPGVSVSSVDLEERLRDERIVHVCRRDFYAILGLPANVTTEVLTQRYESMHAELLARLPPTSPLHTLIPMPEDNLQTVEMKPKKVKATPAATTPAAAPAPAQSNEANGSNHGHEPHTFTFDMGGAQGGGDPAVVAAGDGVVLSMMPSQPHPSVSPSADSSSPAPLTVSQVQVRLQRQIYDLREVWRILKDPVRRVQYDQRRLVLRLDELTNEREEAAAVEESQQLKNPSIKLASTSPPAASEATPTDSSSDGIDLDRILVRATLASNLLPVSVGAPSRPNGSPGGRKYGGIGAAFGSADYKDEHEEKYTPFAKRTNEDDSTKPYANTLPSIPSFSSTPAATNGPLAISKPDAQTRWILGETVEILWDPATTALESAYTSTGGSASFHPDPAHRVRLELLRRRPLVKDTVSLTLSTDADNSGRFQFVLPKNLPPRQDYYIRLTLRWTDTVNLNINNDNNNNNSNTTDDALQVTRSGVFAIEKWEKQSTYVEALENRYDGVSTSPPAITSSAPQTNTSTDMHFVVKTQTDDRAAAQKVATTTPAATPAPSKSVTFHTDESTPRA